MENPVHFGYWDVALIALVSLQGTIIAYLHAPRWKVLGLALPIPFTLGSLAVGEPVGSLHIAGVLLLIAFSFSVLFLHYFVRLPIVLSIALPAVGYCVAGTFLANVLPKTDEAFWIVVAVGFAAGLLLHRLVPFRGEPGHRTPLPIWIKLPAIMLVVASIVSIKQFLHGFLTMFPMVGVITCYEARKSLWTVCRYIAIIVMGLAFLMSAVRVSQTWLGIGPALALGWIVYLSFVVPLFLRKWRHEGCVEDLIDEQQ